MEQMLCTRCGQMTRAAPLVYVRVFACDHCMVLLCRPQDLEAVTDEIAGLGGVEVAPDRAIPVNCLSASARWAA